MVEDREVFYGLDRVSAQLTPDELRGAIAATLRRALMIIEDPMIWSGNKEKLTTVDECAYRVRYLAAVMLEAADGEK